MIVILLESIGWQQLRLSSFFADIKPRHMLFCMSIHAAKSCSSWAGHTRCFSHCPCPPLLLLLQAKVCDFGLAKYNSSSMNQTYHQTKAYTQEYTSPERLTSFRRSKPDDVYAFGILLYFLASSRTPFTDISAQDLDRAVVKGMRPDMEAWANSQQHSSVVTQQLVKPYCELTRQCWHQQPEQRPEFEAVFSRLTAMLRN
jgi:serine/threonine protein kinase